MLQDILNQVAEILLQVTGITTILNGIASAVGMNNQGPTIKQVFNLVQDEGVQIFNQPTGLNAIATNVTAIGAAIPTNQAAILAAIAALQTALTPVTLPTIPPTGYGGGGGGIAAADVWDYVLSGIGAPAGTIVEGLMLSSWLDRFERAAPLTISPDFYVVAGVSPPAYATPTVIPFVDWANLLATDTPLTFLNREYPAFTWISDPLNPSYTVTSNVESGVTFAWIFRFNLREFDVLKSASSVSTLRFPPIWPGGPAVTLGTTLDLAATVDVPGPMDGILLVLTTTPPDKPHYVLGDQTATAHIGQVAFQTPEGHMEYPQALSFADHVYVPHSMVVAGACKLRCVTGVTGTVTPWTAIV